ncbi:MAG: rod shape-determining protein [Porticoccaceae bacterium]|nr:rod shape-determining protein [Porticoccaceae bacterium]
MIKAFESLFYVQIWEFRIKVTDFITGEIFDDKPEAFIRTEKKGTKKIVAVGSSSNEFVGQELEVINPFSHPRMLVSDFVICEGVIQHIFQKLNSKRFLAVKPKVIIQPMEKLDGGLTIVEEKVFRELALGAGAREVVVHKGAELSASGCDFDEIKKANSKSENARVGLQPQKVNPLVLVFWVAVIGGVAWLSN